MSSSFSSSTPPLSGPTREPRVGASLFLRAPGVRPIGIETYPKRRREPARLADQPTGLAAVGSPRTAGSPVPPEVRYADFFESDDVDAGGLSIA